MHLAVGAAAGAAAVSIKGVPGVEWILGMSAIQQVIVSSFIAATGSAKGMIRTACFTLPAFMVGGVSVAKQDISRAAQYDMQQTILTAYGRTCPAQGSKQDIPFGHGGKITADIISTKYSMTTTISTDQSGKQSSKSDVSADFTANVKGVVASKNLFSHGYTLKPVDKRDYTITGVPNCNYTFNGPV